MKPDAAFATASPRRGSWLERLNCPKIWLLAGAFSIISVILKEVMFLVLATDVGRRDERYLAEAIYAVILGLLLAKFLESAVNLHRSALARAEVTADMNHHIRNALQVIIFQCRQCNMPEPALQQISESLQRVDWALREVLPREHPVPLALREESLYQWSQSRSNGAE